MSVKEVITWRHAVAILVHWLSLRNFGPLFRDFGPLLRFKSTFSRFWSTFTILVHFLNFGTFFAILIHMHLSSRDYLPGPESGPPSIHFAHPVTNRFYEWNFPCGGIFSISKVPVYLTSLYLILESGVPSLIHLFIWHWTHRPNTI